MITVSEARKFTKSHRFYLRSIGVNVPMLTASPEDRFHDSYIPEPNSGCWLWTGVTDKDGYGVFRFGGQPRHRGHRAAWKLFKGPIPDGLQVLHRCDVPSCVNPGHLFLGTNDDNMRDRNQKKRHCYGARQWEAKLTENQVIAIRADGRLQREIASDYGITQVNVSAIKRRKIWAHL